MTKGIGLQSMQKHVRQFWVVGRQNPTEANPNPTCYRIRVFAKNEVLARSKFWYEMKRQNKVRKIQGEIVNVSEIFERKTSSVKVYGILFKYLTRTGVVNMYKEFRTNSLCNAVSQLYNEVAGRHRASAESVHIIKTMVVERKDIQRAATREYSKTSLKFPKMAFLKRAPTAAHKSTFAAKRPILV
jgi:large subunit ribosomal protein L18Ae